uniref:Uncharacterized protein n=1 Tax=Anguilla anguilla TaxID=7936 RepID=A0A0E9RUV3_ANGAN
MDFTEWELFQTIRFGDTLPRKKKCTATSGMSHGLTGYMIWHAGSAFFICFQKSQNNYIYHKNTIYLPCFN